MGRGVGGGVGRVGTNVNICLQQCQPRCQYVHSDWYSTAELISCAKNRLETRG